MPALLLGLALAAPVRAELPRQKFLTFDAAETIGRAAYAACDRAGYDVTVLVVDRANQPMVLLRDDRAANGTAEMVRLKANSVMAFGLPSGDYAKFGPPLLPTMTNGAGALPIKVGNELIGAVAVSGAPEGAKDVACAQAGLAKAADKLK
jgi:uncharacterized protein GlcG (DUF336 family)